MIPQIRWGLCWGAFLGMIWCREKGILAGAKKICTVFYFFWIARFSFLHFKKIILKKILNFTSLARFTFAAKKSVIHKINLLWPYANCNYRNSRSHNYNHWYIGLAYIYDNFRSVFSLSAIIMIPNRPIYGNGKLKCHGQFILNSDFCVF
jgi:hypothetical protein